MASSQESEKIGNQVFLQHQCCCLLFSLASIDPNFNCFLLPSLGCQNHLSVLQSNQQQVKGYVGIKQNWPSPNFLENVKSEQFLKSSDMCTCFFKEFAFAWHFHLMSQLYQKCASFKYLITFQNRQLLFLFLKGLCVTQNCE